MKRHTGIVTAGVMAAMLASACLAGCGVTEEQREAAEKYQKEADTYVAQLHKSTRSDGKSIGTDAKR